MKTRLVFSVFSTFSFPRLKQKIFREWSVCHFFAAWCYIVKDMTAGYLLFTLDTV